MIVRDSRSPRGRDEGPHKTTSVLDLDLIGGGLGSGETDWRTGNELKYVRLRGGERKTKKAA